MLLPTITSTLKSHNIEATQHIPQKLRNWGVKTLSDLETLDALSKGLPPGGLVVIYQSIRFTPEDPHPHLPELEVFATAFSSNLSRAWI